jgi:hypothetical protein
MLSTKYKYWKAIRDIRLCYQCEKNHGKIYLIEEVIIPKPPLHPKCRCKIERVAAFYAGDATNNKNNGADWWLKYYGELPEYYITAEEAYLLGWERGKKLSKVVPDKMLTAGVYNNRDGHLPDAVGRIWYEADINYQSGKRNSCRIVWSNDGLIFVTFDHYETFCEIV